MKEYGDQLLIIKHKQLRSLMLKSRGKKSTYPLADSISERLPIVRQATMGSKGE